MIALDLIKPNKVIIEFVGGIYIYIVKTHLYSTLVISQIFDAASLELRSTHVVLPNIFLKA